MSLNNMGLGFLFTAKDLASGVMGKVKESIHEVGGEAEALKSSMTSTFKAFGVGAGLMALGAAGFAALGPAIAESKELSKAIALVATEADLSIFPQEEMRDAAEKLAVTYGNAPVDQAKALYKAVALGANTAAKSVDFLNGVNLLAVAGNADLELSANALGGALNAYGAPFSKATDYSDALFVAMKNGNTTVQDLAGAIGRVTSSAANLNIPIEEVLGAVSVMTNKGVAAAEAVSGLKEALANVIHPSEDARKEAARLGIHFTQAEVRAKGLQGFLREISSSSKFTAESFSKLFTSVEGSNAIMQVASGNMQSFDSVMEAMAHKTGATQAGFEIMNATLDFQEKKFESNKKVILGMIGSALEPLAAKVLGIGNLILMVFGKIPKPIIAFGAKMVLVASSALVLVGGVIALKAAFALLATGLSAVGLSLGGVLLIAAPVLAAFGLVALAAVTVKQAWEHNLGGFRDTVTGVYEKLKLTFTALYELFTGGGFTADTWKQLEAKTGIKNFAISVYVWVGRIQNFLAGLVGGFQAGIGQLGPTFDAFGKAIDRVGSAMGDLIGGPTNPTTAGQAFDEFGKKGASVGEKIAKVLGDVLDVVTMLTFGVANMIDGWRGVGDVDSAWNQFGDTLHGIFDTIRGIVKAIEFIVGAAGKLKSAFEFVHGGDPFSDENRKKLEAGGSGPSLGQLAGAAKSAFSGPFSAENRRRLEAGSIGGAPAGSPIPTISYGSDGAGVSSFASVGAPPMEDAAQSAAAGSVGGTVGDIGALEKHLADISRNTSNQSPVVHGIVTLDGEQVGKFTAKNKKSDDSRSFTPSRVET